MPLHLDSITQKDQEKILDWMIGYELDKSDDIFSTVVEGERYCLMSRPLIDVRTRKAIGRYVITLHEDRQQIMSEIFDADIVLDNPVPTKLMFEQKLPQSSDANEYYIVITGEEAHLIAETVDRYTVPGQIEGTEREVYVSIFPFAAEVFDDEDAYNRGMGGGKPEDPSEGPGLSFSTTFACPASLFGTEEEDDEPFSLLAGEVLSVREVTFSFGSTRCDAFIAMVHTTLGDVPVVLGEGFDTEKLAAGKIIVMEGYVKVDFVKDRYE